MCEPWLTFIKFLFRDLLDVLLSHQMKAGPSSSFYGKLGYYGILNDYIELFFAGMETTTSSLMWCFLYYYIIQIFNLESTMKLMMLLAEEDCPHLMIRMKCITLKLFY